MFKGFTLLFYQKRVNLAMEVSVDHQIIKRLFKDPIHHIERLDKGLTNKNYKVFVNDDVFVVRIPYLDSEHVVNYTNEKQALAIVKDKNIDVDTIYFDEASGIKITRFVDQLLSFSEYPHQDKYEKVGQLMRKFHDLKTLSHHEFNPLDILRTYQAYVDEPLIPLDQAQVFIDYVKANRQVDTLCHNDWVNDNIVFHPKQVYLLDYEYAGDNDARFDITSFLSENKIIDPLHRHAFLKAYYKTSLTFEIEKTLLYWEGFHDILWSTWAMMMHKQRHQPIFLEIAHDKKQAFERIRKLL